MIPPESARETLKQRIGDTLNYLVIGERLENQVHDGDSNLAWEKSFGNMADQLQAAGKEKGETFFVMGIRLWY